MSLRPHGVVAVVLLCSLGVTQESRAQHTFGINFQKSCPDSAAPGEQVTCTLTLQNNDDQHAVIILSLTDKQPFGLPGIPDGPPVAVETCIDGEGQALGTAPFQLAAADGIYGGPDFATCDIVSTLPVQPGFCGITWLDQAAVTIQDAALPVIMGMDQTIGLTVITCTCGDGIVNGDEFCDGAMAEGCNEPCRDDCTCCGDGMINGGEYCDDGNQDNEDDCRNDCTACGDGIINGGEFCDDGNDENNDECRNDCTACGDGVVNGDEECDDGNDYNYDDCPNECIFIKIHCSMDSDCEDGDACSIDNCSSEFCTYSPAPDGTPCDDHDACTAEDLCDHGNCVGTPVQCPADIDGDCVVGAADLAQLLGGWGPNPGHPADLNQDGLVNAVDLAALLGNWGTCT